MSTYMVQASGPILFVHTAQHTQYMSQLTTSCVVRLRSRILHALAHDDYRVWSVWTTARMITKPPAAPARNARRSFEDAHTETSTTSMMQNQRRIGANFRGKRATTDREDHRSIRVCSLDNNGLPEQEKIRPPKNKGERPAPFDR